ncbi:Beta-phosphoglucomutase [Roseivivax jejudonensis]|uniref:Beta-phosphoglucomutase n=1 Tax=Roseivivax jejudonensis TaxID=1529041 RepID=A0A1X6YFR1_9RHOB|nr:HAD-IA family hydrolase [Roseivivax jejudonensis]SLN19441.1 Beta-phosphoglucomutase [Roseivivax jejudonensis]
MPGLFLGSIGVLAETSHLQLQSFNEAFAEAGLDWQWSESAYREMLKDAGGKARIESYAMEKGADVDAEALHARKSALFQSKLDAGVPLRAGVADAMADARARGWTLAFVTATSPDNVEAVLDATGLSRDDFDLVLDKSSGLAPKPDPAVYAEALSRLSLSDRQALAVEDNPDGMAAAAAAGITCIAFPGAFHDPAAFDHAALTLDRLYLPQDLTAA